MILKILNSSFNLLISNKLSWIQINLKPNLIQIWQKLNQTLLMADDTIHLIFCWYKMKPSQWLSRVIEYVHYPNRSSRAFIKTATKIAHNVRTFSVFCVRILTEYLLFFWFPICGQPKQTPPLSYQNLPIFWFSSVIFSLNLHIFQTGTIFLFLATGFINMTSTPGFCNWPSPVILENLYWVVRRKQR